MHKLDCLLRVKISGGGEKNMSTKQAKGVHVNGTTTPKKKGCSCGGEGTTIQQLSTVFPQLKSLPRQMTFVGFFLYRKNAGRDTPITTTFVSE